MTTHLATSLDIGRAVQRTLRVPTYFVPDDLLVGPCAQSPDVHHEARLAYWELDRRERARFRASSRGVMKALASRARVIVWTSRLWSDVVALWGLAAFRLLLRPRAPGIEVVVLGSAADGAFGRGSIRVTGTDVREGLGGIEPLPVTRVREMARFWRKLAGRSPILASAGRRDARGRAELFAIGAYQAGFFPRLDASRLVLAPIDHLLLSCVEDGWSTPANVFMRDGAAGEALRRWASHTGDVFLAMRLRAWAAHGQDRAALVREPHRPDRIMLEARYKLSSAGAELLREGLGEVAQAPPLAIGGAVAYDPRAPWVVVGDAADALAAPSDATTFRRLSR